VNSTSVPAWKALLTSLSGQSFRTYNYNANTPQDWTPSATFTNPIPRFWSASYGSTPNVPWEGMRCMTDAQVTCLAQEIVKQVRLRGPFLSMGDFLNRRLGNTTNQINTMGALQAAIENTQTNSPSSTYDVNYCIHSVFNQAVNVASLSCIFTNTAVGIPGYLMQQDLVQAFAPVMTPRSDTFVIRVYGEAQKPVGTSSPSASGSSSMWNAIAPNTQSQAWGEAVVQRLPEYYDQTDTSLTTASVTGISSALGDATPPRNSSGNSILSALNQAVGRRFRVVSFRWLNQNEL